MNKVVFICLALFIYGCGNNSSSSSTAVPADLTGFSVVDFANSPVSKAMKVNTAGNIEEEGELVNGVKNGTWVTYYPNDGRVKSVTNFVNGKKNGLHMEMTNRGQVDLQCFYADDILDGKWSKYKFGNRLEKEVNYKMGKFDGFYREYHSNGKMMREIQYKNGIKDGMFKQFNDQEQVILEYTYKNDEKVSGGVVTPPPVEEETK